jgi:UDP-N-acetylmuramyl tripeptide synthase
MLKGLRGSEVELVTPAGPLRLTVPLPGLYNAYNAIAAAAAALAFGLEAGPVAAGIASVHAAFGRFEQVDLHGRKLVLLLAKNPTGLNQALGVVLTHEGSRHAIFALNDLIADGTDVSWIWDGDFERLAGKLDSAAATGIRAADMALRLKYAGISDGHSIPVTVEVGDAVTAAARRLPEGETLFVVATYTAMLDLRRSLVQAGVIRHYLDQ